MSERVEVPARARAVIEQLQQEIQQRVATLDAFVQGVATTLDVPQGWQLQAEDGRLWWVCAPEAPQAIEEMSEGT